MVITKRNNINSLKIAYWNANGLKSKMYELAEYIERNNFDLFLVGETHLTAPISIKLPNYNFYRNDRIGRPGGGTGIFIKRNIAHKIIPLPTLTVMEATIIEINFKTIGNTRIVACYYPPNKPFERDDYLSLLHPNIPTLLVGDLNAKHLSWGSNINNQYGNELFHICNTQALLIYAPINPTHFSTRNTSDIIDIAVNKNVNLNIEITSEDELSSDHNPIVLQLGDNEYITESITLKKTDWDKFREIFENFGKIKRINNTEELEDEINYLTNFISTAIHSATTSTLAPITKYYNIPNSLKDLIKEKRQARKLANLTHDPQDKLRANQLNNQVKKELYNFKNNKWSEKIESFNTDKDSFWKITKVLTGKRVRANIPPLTLNNITAISDEEKAEMLAINLENIFTPNDIKDPHKEKIEKIENDIDNLLNNVSENEPIEPTSLKELLTITKYIKNNKAPGPDNITNKALKELPPKIYTAIVSYFNAALRLKHFPNAFKKANIIVFPKPKKDHSLPDNYRPISLLSSLGKVFEAIILNRIKNQCEKLDILPNFQFGFRTKHSTEQQVHRITEYITEGFGENESTAAIFLDISRAFDKIWHNGLIYKLIKFKFNGNIVKLIKSYLLNRTFRIKIDDTFSSWKNIKAGVPQGSILSPTLYIIYTSDMPKPMDTIIATFADDTAILTSEENPNYIHSRLQRGINHLESWFSLWRLEINEQKSVAVIFSKKRNIQIREITINNIPLSWSESAKYLGVTLDKKLTFASHINNKINQAKFSLKNLLCLLGKNSKLNLNNKLTLYKTIIRPTMAYGAQSWAIASKTNKYKFEIIQNKVLRIITQAPWFVRNSQLRKDLKIPSFSEFIQEKLEKFFAIAESHPNSLIRNASNYEIEDIIKHKRPKMALDQ